MRYDDDDAFCVAHDLDRARERGLALGVEIGIGLVEHDQKGIAIKRAGERDLFVPVRRAFRGRCDWRVFLSTGAISDLVLRRVRGCLHGIRRLVCGNRAQDLPQVEARRNSGHQIEEQLKPPLLTLKFRFCVHSHMRTPPICWQNPTIQMMIVFGLKSQSSGGGPATRWFHPYGAPKRGAVHSRKQKSPVDKFPRSPGPSRLLGIEPINQERPQAS